MSAKATTIGTGANALRRTGVIPIAGLALFLAACRPSEKAREPNPFYVRGTKLLSEGDRDAAREAFEKCLRMTPGAADAHLQLGMLYDNVYRDPLYALYHYRRFLELAPGHETAPAVERWAAEAEEDLLVSWQPALAAPPPTERLPEEEPERRDSPTPLERALAERVKELNTEVLNLREELDAARTVGIAAAPATRPNSRREGAPPPTPAPEEHVRSHRVRAGESLSSISRTYYGTLKYWPKLRDANRDVLKNGTTLVAGTVLTIPPESYLQREAETGTDPGRTSAGGNGSPLRGGGDTGE